MTAASEDAPGHGSRPSAPLSPEAGGARPDLRFGGLVAAIFAVTLLPRIVAHVFWRDELQAWMIATSGDPSLAAVLQRADYEGHPYAWFVVLWSIASAWADPMAMKLAHAAIATGIAFVIAAFAPMRRHLRVLLCLGYFFLFEYAAISRNYGLGVLPLLGFAAVRTWRPEALRTQAGLLAIAAQANVFAGLLAIAAAGWAGVRWVRDGRRGRGRYVTAIVIVGAGIASLCYQLLGAPDRRFAAAAFRLSLQRLRQSLGGFWQVFVPVPAADRHWWNSNLLDYLGDAVNPTHLLAAAGAATALAVTWLLPPRRDVRLLWLAGAGIIVAFGTLRYPGFPRHTGHLFVLFVLAWWLSHDRAAARTPAPETRARTRALYALLVVQAIAGVAASVADYLLPFSASRAAAAFVASRYPDALVIANSGHENSPIAGLLERPLYYADRSRWGTYIRWDETPVTQLTPESYAQLAVTLNADAPTRPVLLMLSHDAKPEPDPRRFRQVATFEDSSVESEQFTAYQFIPDAPTTAPARPEAAESASRTRSSECIVTTCSGMAPGRTACACPSFR